MQKTVGDLISEVQTAFAGAFSLPTEFLLSEYNAFARALHLQLPGHDAEQTVTAQDGMLRTELCPEQIRRVYVGEQELLRASAALLTLLDAPLYAVTQDGILVRGGGEHRICYRTLPAPVTADTAGQTPLPFDLCELPLLRAYLFRRAYLYVGDSECASVSGAEYEKLLAAYRAAHGVRA